MAIHRPALRKLALSTFLFVVPLTSAHALEANALGDRLKALTAKQGGDIQWTKVTENGAQIVLEGVTVGVTGKPDRVPLGNVTLDDVTEQNGAYKIGKITLPAYNVTEDGVTMDITGVEVAGLTLPAEGTTDPLSSIMLYDTADVGLVSFKKGDKPVFAMNDLHIEVTPPVDGKEMAFTGSADKFTADLSTIDDPQSKPVIEALGYNNIEGNFEIEGSWQPTDGHLELSQYDITVDKAGTLGMTFDLGGYTPDLVKALQDMQKKMAEKKEGADNSAEGMAMLGLLQQLTFKAASVRFDDDSLTGKVLDYVGKQQGMKGSDIANQAKAIVPFLMAQLNNPELTATVTTAVTKYLDDPKSIEVSAAPESAVPFALIMAGAMSGSPQDLIKTLAVTVTANEDD